MNMNSKNNGYTPFIISREGECCDFQLVEAIVNYLRTKTEVYGFNFGNSYNMPIYLLGELESCENPLVFLVNWNEEGYLEQRCLAGEFEIAELMKALEVRTDEDAWQIAMEVNARIREEQVN